MLETEVLAHCGEPASVRDLGFAVRSFHPLAEGQPQGGVLFRFGSGAFFHEVHISEYVYNFGPRKLMHRLRFEGGILTDVDTLGHGYRERDAR